MAKNLAAKRRKLNAGEAPYEVWTDRYGSWVFLVVKKNQAPDKEATNPYAIWNVACVTPHERDLYGHDTYVTDVKRNMRLVWIDPEYIHAIVAAGQELTASQRGADDTPDGWKRYVS